jgi:hypothetical protein
VCGQSDGKSSLLEALLGFRFNVCEVEMGTRAPSFSRWSTTHPPSNPTATSRFSFLCALLSNGLVEIFGKNGKMMEIELTYAVHVETIGPYCPSFQQVK